MRTGLLATSLLGSLLGCGPDVPVAGPRASDPPDAAIAARDATPPDHHPWEPRDPEAPLLPRHPEPPISGGTLLATRDGRFVVGADPALDVVHVIDVATFGDPDADPTRAVVLADRDEPGRLAEDDDGLVHVALRRAGEIATIDPATATLVRRFRVCPAPRGIAWRAADDTLHVACASGELVTTTATGEFLARVELEPDLRDVVIAGEARLVSVFRRAEVLVVTESGVVTERIRPSARTVASRRELPTIEGALTFEPAVAWRMIDAGAGRALLLHQRALANAIPISAPDVTPGSPTPAPYGGGGFSGSVAPTGCGGLVEHAITEITPGVAPIEDHSIATGALTIDVARSAHGVSVASAFSSMPRDVSLQGRGIVLTLGEATVPLDDPACLATTITGRTTSPRALAADPAGSLWVQSATTIERIAPGGASTVRELAPARTDYGMMVFHARTRAGVACASCHPEGGDDGHTWRFLELGARRTQSLGEGVLGTAPFHWDGDLHDFRALLLEVLVRRTGTSSPSDAVIASTEEWIASLSAPPRPIADDAAVARGRAIFERADVGCATCHGGETFGGLVAADVGTGGVLQAPSLRGVVYRAPLMHDGCAADLRARFEDDACGGGDRHGTTGHLAPAEIDDLIAFLRTI